MCIYKFKILKIASYHKYFYVYKCMNVFELKDIYTTLVLSNYVSPEYKSGAKNGYKL